MLLNLRAKMLQTSIYKLGNERKVRKEYNKKGNSFGVFIFPIFKYRKKKFKESLKLVSVKKKLILYFIKIDILYLFVFCY